MPSPRPTFSGYRFHEKRKGSVEGLGTGGFAFEVPHPHDDEVVRWDDQGRLAASTVHEVRVPGHGQRAITIDPEERAVNGTLIRFPRWCHRADEFDVPFRQNPLAVPNAILEVQITQAGPVSCRRQFVA